MKRTQIYIDEDTFERLEKESKIKHKTISELIRDSVNYRRLRKTDEIIMKMNAVFGAWRKRYIDTEQYIRRMRRDRHVC